VLRVNSEGRKEMTTRGGGAEFGWSKGGWVWGGILAVVCFLFHAHDMLLGEQCRGGGKEGPI
jgi:hypothetical protein